MSLIQRVEGKALHTMDIVTFETLYMYVNALAHKIRKTLY